jgi:glycine cleavage system H lipoate-binding protein
MRRAAEENTRLRREGKEPSGRKGKIVSWKARLNEMPAWRRPCIHHLKGKIEFRACSNDYRCSNCEFDQFFMDDYSVRAIVKPVELLEVKGISIPQGYYLHKGHGWVRIEEGHTVKIGIDDFANRLFGPFDRVESPLMGKEIKQGRPAVKLRSGAQEAGMLAPVSGVVISANNSLLEGGSSVSKAPYEAGWFITVHATDLRNDLKRLMINREAMRFIGQEIDDLYRAIEESRGPLNTDGGFLGSEILAKMPELDWSKMTKRFMRT